MNYTSLILFILITFQFTSCSKKNLSKLEQVNSPFVMPELTSSVNLNYEIDKKAINDTFNIIIDQYLDTDLEIDAIGADVKISKEQDATMEFLGTQVLSTLPIKIEIEKSTFIKNITGQGQLELNFITGIDIDSNWTLITHTELAAHKWIEKPSLNLGGIQFNVSMLADEIIKRSKPTLEQQIDKSVADQISFKDRLLDMLKYVEEPILIDTLMNSWLSIQPQNVYMSHIKNEEESATGNVTIQGKTIFSSVKPDNIPGIKLPQFEWNTELDDTSHINVVLDISYDQVNQYLSENYKGETLMNGDKQVTIHDIFLKREGEKLVVVSDVTGSVNGQLLVSGTPVFDNKKQKFYTDDIDIDIQTKNVIHKAGAWLFKAKIKNKLKDMLDFSVQENLDQMQELINEQIDNYSIDNEIEFIADLRQLQVERFVLDNDKIHAFVTLDIFLQSKIHNLNALNNPSYFNIKN